jgi:hypothetical protein
MATVVLAAKYCHWPVWIYKTKRKASENSAAPPETNETGQNGSDKRLDRIGKLTPLFSSGNG